ncbi:probable leucine-rich repeat receptor-like protein kinase At1g68400 [Zingiber officinale]|uniref:Protein kinase domain-containing protein n=1 Tax=Zingiber officinale TaxID=94328 RepID=A0A8J5GGX9_ZINOF|nr:probable leucine-rich repeat receptor-like protein kinase At1g68400 [Zingiber officinale]KAG6501313.1 hypothetical protein ZIOFF_041192 [Zingiber officinale]
MHDLNPINASRTGRTLDWATRKRILVTAGDGLAFIHKFPTRYPLVRANLKPSNILIDEQGNGCVSEWGIMRFAANIRCSPGDPSGCSSDRGTFTAVTPASQRYLAPELASGKEQATQESDVYSFCMMIQKVATDKEMEDGEIQEEEISGMVKIALLCTAGRTERRPEMSQVVRMMGEFL